MPCTLSKKPYKRYSFIGPDYAYGHSQWEAFQKDLKKLKPDVEILDAVWVKVGETNYSPYIPTLMSKKPEIVYSSLWGGGLSSFIKQAKPFGIFKNSSVTSIYDLTMLKASGLDMPEGLLGYTRCAFYAVDTPEMKAFAKKFHEKYNEWPDDWAIFCYDGLTVLTDAIKKANSTDSDQLVKIIPGMHYKSLTGDRYIRAEDHQANVGFTSAIQAEDDQV